MKTIKIALLLSFISLTLCAQQGFEGVLKEVESNNTQLKALRQQADANKAANITNIFLENPEVGFHYLWGDPSSIGTRKDFSISQSFDFPTAYGYRKNISGMKNELADLEYEAGYKEIMYEVKTICIELVYLKALKHELDGRLANAQQIAEAYQKQFDSGETNILERNKAALNWKNHENEVSRIALEIGLFDAELQKLNGGIEITSNISNYPIKTIPQDFEAWYQQSEQNNPILKYVRQQVEVNKKEEKLVKAESLPKFSAGYMSEKGVSEQFQGISVGVSIPLWENKNKAKAAKAHTSANQALAKDTKTRFYNELKKQHSKAQGLSTTLQNYRESLKEFSNESLLQKALDAGEISLIEYLLETQFVYEARDKILETEKEFQQAIAELEEYQ